MDALSRSTSVDMFECRCVFHIERIVFLSSQLNPPLLVDSINWISEIGRNSAIAKLLLRCVCNNSPTSYTFRRDVGDVPCSDQTRPDHRVFPTASENNRSDFTTHTLRFARGKNRNLAGISQFFSRT